MSEKPRRGLLSGIVSGGPNLELAVLELAKAVLRMESVVTGLAERAYDTEDARDKLTRRVKLRELDEARNDIARALNAITGKRNGE